VLDSLGWDVAGIAHNRFPDNGAVVEARYLTFTKLDAEGKPLWIRDARGNLVMQYVRSRRPTPVSNTQEPETYVPAYDIAGNLLFQHSMDAGDRWMLNDAGRQTDAPPGISTSIRPMPVLSASSGCTRLTTTLFIGH